MVVAALSVITRSQAGSKTIPTRAAASLTELRNLTSYHYRPSQVCPNAHTWPLLLATAAASSRSKWGELQSWRRLRANKLAAAISSLSFFHPWLTPGVLRLMVGVAEIQIAEINRERKKTL